MSNENKIEFYVHGMMCHHCESHVKKALENAGANNIEIDLTTKKVVVTSSLSKDEIFSLIKEAGYEATDN